MGDFSASYGHGYGSRRHQTVDIQIAAGYGCNWHPRNNRGYVLKTGYLKILWLIINTNILKAYNVSELMTYQRGYIVSPMLMNVARDT